MEEKTVFWVDSSLGYWVMHGTATPIKMNGGVAGFTVTPAGGGTPRYVDDVYDSKAGAIAEKDDRIDRDIEKLITQKG